MKQAQIRAIEEDLHRMRLEIERFLDCHPPAAVLSRNGSVRGRKLLVYNTLRKIRLRNRWKKDYVAEEDGKVVVYTTSCGIVRHTWERCRDTVELLRALNIRVEIRDLNLDARLLDELINRLALEPSDKDFVYGSLPLVYVNGKYFGNDSTLFECNEAGQLVQTLSTFKGRRLCTFCGDSGYTLCAECHGGKKSLRIFQNRSLRCATCDENGIVPCRQCL
ncbi:hypothetical protein QR680_012595 [Steinernema hermaphroditum]|uniref:Glutaredoxin domain-containing protein n=1 Tax=Steinernema hermaphroditum TaxID=289476 RepID=A0AA39I3U8_9BILA|nr:hypothetical protein QR680_012595 [Steinernema hermaphroditum]